MIISQPGAAAVCLSQCRWFDATAWRGCVRFGVTPQPAVFSLFWPRTGLVPPKQARAVRGLFFSFAAAQSERQTDRLHTKHTQSAGCQSTALLLLQYNYPLMKN